MKVANRPMLKFLRRIVSCFKYSNVDYTSFYEELKRRDLQQRLKADWDSFSDDFKAVIAKFEVENAVKKQKR